jgi:hypothetical protein
MVWIPEVSVVAVGVTGGFPLGSGRYVTCHNGRQRERGSDDIGGVQISFIRKSSQATRETIIRVRALRAGSCEPALLSASTWFDKQPRECRAGHSAVMPQHQKVSLRHSTIRLSFATR